VRTFAACSPAAWLPAGVQTPNRWHRCCHNEIFIKLNAVFADLSRRRKTDPTYGWSGYIPTRPGLAQKFSRLVYVEHRFSIRRSAV